MFTYQNHTDRPHSRSDRSRRLHCERLEERNLLAVVTVDTHLDTVDFNDGVTSLREAIFAANLIDGADTIDFNAALAGKTILLTLGELAIADSLTIVGLGADLLSIDASGNDPTPELNNGDGSRVFNVYDSSDLIDVDIRDLTLSGGDSSQGGGAILVNSENLSVSRLSITNNSTTNLGGAIQNLYGTLVVNESYIADNSAVGNGGGIHSLLGELTLAHSTIFSNSSAHDAGGIWSSGLTAIANSSVSSNTSDGVGGGLKSTGSLTITLSTISGNSAFDNGGGIWIDSTADIDTSSIDNNFSQNRGGGLFSGYLSVVTLSDSTVSGNIAGHTGGGIEGRESEISLFDSTVAGNSTSGTGGGIRNDVGQLTVTRSTISGNSSSDGGGIWSFLATTSMYQSTISGNSASAMGGGIYSLGGTQTIANSTITENIADSDSNGIGTGGGIHGDTTIDHTIIANNFRAVSIRDDLSGSVAASFSLIGDESGALITDNGGNYIGTTLSPIDPLLVPLADNGGSAFTHALQPTSPALDAGEISLRQGDPGVPEFDQRNSPYVRVVGTRIDIGAIEQEGIPIVVDTLVDESDGDFSRFDISLREAIELANSQPGGQTISFDPLLTGGTIVLTMGELEITDSIEIQGLGTSLLTIDASGNDPTPDSTISDGNRDNDGDGSRIFYIVGYDYLGSKIDVILAGLTLTGGDAYEAGGAINSQENLYLDEVSIVENNSRDSGGGVYSNGNLTLRKAMLQTTRLRSTLSLQVVLVCTCNQVMVVI